MYLSIKMERRPLKFMRFRDRFGGNANAGLYAATDYFTGKVKKKYYSGAPLNVRTGRLGQSPTTKPVKKTPTGMSCQSGTNVEYAPVHEKGLWVPRFRAGRSGGTSGFKMPKRPVWEPTAEKEHSRMAQIFWKYCTKPLRGL